MFTIDLEKKILEIQSNDDLQSLIASLPEPNAQGEIKADLDGLLATIEVKDGELTYLKRADRGLQLNGVLITVDPTAMVVQEIKFDGSESEPQAFPFTE